MFEFKVPADAERFVMPGDVIAAGQVVFRVFAADGSTTDVRSPFAGRVVKIAAGRFAVESVEVQS